MLGLYHIENFEISNLNKPFDKPDIVIFQECYQKEYLRISKLLEKREIPYVIIPHGELSFEAQQKKHLKKEFKKKTRF